MNPIGEFYQQSVLENMYYSLSSNLLEGTGDDKVSMVHGNQVSGELA
jgi:hypothetical protein